jgi:hypothetical protein
MQYISRGAGKCRLLVWQWVVSREPSIIQRDASCILPMHKAQLHAPSGLRAFPSKIWKKDGMGYLFESCICECPLFRDIFRYLGPNSNLHYLELRVLSWDLEQFPPIYSTSLPQPLQQAAKYNLSFRPATHLLAKLRSISSLTVIGHPTGEIEEALFKLSMELEERGKNEGKQVEKVDTKVEDQSLGKSPWFYKIQIKD